jgi:hypothetical protein
LAIGLACLALLLQAMLPLTHFDPTRSQASSMPDWILASICATDPTSLEDGHAGGGQPSAVDRLSCSVCLGLQLANGLTPPASITLRAPAVVVSISYLTLGPIAIESVQRTPAQARAPPQTV